MTASDLKERLRDRVTIIGGLHYFADAMTGKSEDAGLHTEAADRIESIEARIARLSEALEPFADVAGEGDEDFRDDTPVTITFGRTTHYAVKLGDLRRAARALAADGGGR